MPHETADIAPTVSQAVQMNNSVPVRPNSQKKRLYVRLTQEEKGYYSNGKKKPTLIFAEFYDTEATVFGQSVTSVKYNYNFTKRVYCWTSQSLAVILSDHHALSIIFYNAPITKPSRDLRYINENIKEIGEEEKREKVRRYKEKKFN